MEYPKYYEVTYKDGSPTGYITEHKMNLGTFRNEYANKIKSIKSILPYVMEGENRVANPLYIQLTGFNQYQMKSIIDSIPKTKVETIAPKDLKTPKNSIESQEHKINNAGNAGTSKRGPKPKLKTAV